MGKTAYLFSGQGSAYTGMGKEFYQDIPLVRQIFDCGSDILGLNLAKLCFEGDEACFGQTLLAQPAIYAMELACLAAVRRELPLCDGVGGHSLGEMAALYACGVYSMEEGFRLIKARAAAMHAAGELQEGAMFAILKADNAQIADVCRQTAGVVLPVNFNCPGQTVIAGELAAATAAAETLAANGARAVRLGVSSAFHTPLMRGAAQDFLMQVGTVATTMPIADFYSNVTAAPMTDFRSLEHYLATHMVSPVQFAEQIAAMIADGYDRFVELGPKKTLSSFLKKIDKTIVVCNVEDAKSLAETVQQMRR